MRRYGERQVKKRVVERVVCDGCRKRLEAGSTDRWEPPEPWVNFNTWHEDWSNDSVESSKEWDACSAACFYKVLKQVVEDYEPIQGAPTLQVSLGIFGYMFAKNLLQASSDGVES